MPVKEWIYQGEQTGKQKASVLLPCPLIGCQQVQSILKVALPISGDLTKKSLTGEPSTWVLVSFRCSHVDSQEQSSQLPKLLLVMVFHHSSKKVTKTLGVITTLQDRTHDEEQLGNTKWIPRFPFTLYAFGLFFLKFCLFFFRDTERERVLRRWVVGYRRGSASCLGKRKRSKYTT